MLNNKTFFTSLALLLATSYMQAENTVKLVVHQTDGQKKEYTLDEIGKIAFTNNDLSITSKDKGTETFTYETVLNFNFDGYITGINTPQTVEQSTQKIRVSVNQDALTVLGWNADKPAKIVIYALNGQQILTINQWDGRSINISQLQKGLYILRINDLTTKFIKK